MTEAVPAENESLPPIFSPQRFFLNAPKQPPGTCFVLNEDFQKAMAEIERLHGLLGRVLASGRLTGHALADKIRAVDMGPR